METIFDIEFQTAETVLPNPTRDQQTIPSFFNTLSNSQLEKNKMNRLIWEDNILAMQALLASGYEGKIGLIYIDPPFWTNEDYYAKFEVWDKEITKLPSIILFTSSFSMAPSLGITINILIHFYW